jgi:hypothetical protein
MMLKQSAGSGLVVLSLVALLGVSACSKKTADATPAATTSSVAPVAAVNPNVAAAERYFQKQEADQHDKDYYNVDNKQRVNVEDGLIDDVNAKVPDAAANAEKVRIEALKANEAEKKRLTGSQQTHG